MARSVALLRAVNVGGTGKVAMSDLRAMCESLGLKEPKTLLQSGNLVVNGGACSPSELEKLLEKGALTKLGLKTEFIVRTRAEWAKIVAGNPFPQEAKSDPSHLLVMLRKTAPTAAHLAALAQLNDGPEKFVARGRELYVTFPEGMGRSRFAAVLSREKVGGPGTGRNWNTVLKLEAMLDE